jgi:hypothetical protein
MKFKTNLIKLIIIDHAPGLAKFEKYSEGVRSRPDIRFIPFERFAVSEFGTLGGHAMTFLTGLAKRAAASKGMHMGSLFACWRRKVSLAVHVAHADNDLRGLSAAAYGVEAASSSVGMPSHATALSTRAMGRKCPRVPRTAREAPLVASTCCILGAA